MVLEQSDGASTYYPRLRLVRWTTRPVPRYPTVAASFCWLASHAIWSGFAHSILPTSSGARPNRDFRTSHGELLAQRADRCTRHPRAGRSYARAARPACSTPLGLECFQVSDDFIAMTLGNNSAVYFSYDAFWIDEESLA